MNNATNPRAVIGSNEAPEAPDYAKLTAEQMAGEYAEVAKTVADLLEEARDVPAVINDDDEKGVVTHLIKRFRDLTKRLETFHAKEKEPFFRRGQGVDQFFFGLIDKCARRDKKNKAGAADILQARLTDYDTRKLAEEQERRRQESIRLQREAQAKADAERAAQVEAAAAREAAERARAPAKIEEKTVVAAAAETVASTAKVEADLAAERAQEAHIATLAKPAEIMRSRDASTGTLSTMGTEPYALITDRDLLDKAKLWPFFTDDAIEKALRAWAKTTNYRQEMEGASVGRKPKSVVR